MEWIFRNQETVAARSKYIHQLSSSNNAHPIEYFVYCSMGTVKFELLSWFSIVRDFWRQHFSVLSQKTNNISVVSSHFHLYLRISALRLPTVSVMVPVVEIIPRGRQQLVYHALSIPVFAPSDMVLIWLSRNIPVSALQATHIATNTTQTNKDLPWNHRMVMIVCYYVS